MSSTKLTRRTFAAGLGVPLILGAQNKSGSARPIAGSGDHTYEVIHDWGELPANIRYGNTHGVCEDSQGRIYIHHTVNAVSESADSMVVFDEQGKFVKSWGKEFKGGAHGLHIRKEGGEEFLYLCDTQRAVVVKSDLDGRVVWTLDYPKQSEPYAKGDGSGKPIKYSPTNVAIAPNGDVYVGDGYGSSYINQYNSKGEYIRTFGGNGAEPGQVSCPHGLIVDTRAGDPVLIVADRAQQAVAALYAGRQAHRLRQWRQPAVPLRHLPQRRHGDPRPGGPGNPGGSHQRGDHAPGRRRFQYLGRIAQAPAGGFQAGQIHLPAWRMLRPRRQYLCRGMG